MSDTETHRECLRNMTAAALRFPMLNAGALFLPPADAVLLLPLTTPVALALLARDEKARRFVHACAEACRAEGGGRVDQFAWVVRALGIEHGEWTSGELEEFARHANVTSFVRKPKGTIRGPGGSA